VSLPLRARSTEKATLAAQVHEAAACGAGKGE
jgi:hypothetical protein